jgi:tRNA(fMet)-specific endonuclease VapC
MTVALDTNTYASFKRGNQELRRMFESADEILVPVTVLGELYSGFQIGRLTEKNMLELEQFLAVPGIRTVSITPETAFRYGFLVKELRRQGTPIPTNDIWIAAVVMEAGSILISRDSHFSHVPGLLVLGY